MIELIYYIFGDFSCVIDTIINTMDPFFYSHNRYEIENFCSHLKNSWNTQSLIHNQFPFIELTRFGFVFTFIMSSQEKLEQMESDRKGFELFNHVSLMTLDVVLRCAFSFETDCQR